MCPHEERTHVHRVSGHEAAGARGHVIRLLFFCKRGELRQKSAQLGGVIRVSLNSYAIPADPEKQIRIIVWAPTNPTKNYHLIMSNLSSVFDVKENMFPLRLADWVFCGG